MLTEQNFLEFRKGYIDALLWSSVNNDAEEEQYFDELANGYEDFTKQAQGIIDRECKDFLESASPYLPEDGLDQVGHYFALTRNGSGSSFWDRVDIYGEEATENLNIIADSFLEISLEWLPEENKVDLLKHW